MNLVFNTDVDNCRVKKKTSKGYMKQKAKKESSLKGVRLVGKSRSRGDMAYESLKRAIIRGDFAPRQRLIETQLSILLKTSRVPIREAIKKLEQDALVEKRKQGFIGRRLSREDIEEITTLRTLLEGYAIHLASERMTNELFKNLQNNMKAYHEVLDSGALGRLIKLDMAFHKAIYKTAQNNKLYALINNLRDSIYLYRSKLWNRPGYAHTSLLDHKNILMAMKGNDMDKADQVLRTHILRDKEIIIKEMELGKHGRR